MSIHGESFHRFHNLLSGRRVKRFFYFHSNRYGTRVFLPYLVTVVVVAVVSGVILYPRTYFFDRDIKVAVGLNNIIVKSVHKLFFSLIMLFF